MPQEDGVTLLPDLSMTLAWEPSSPLLENVPGTQEDTFCQSTPSTATPYRAFVHFRFGFYILISS
ncbi:hypothetical protein CCUS01_05693 [Colletotrichum cuscutae]|uniref:Uncharacterized protein n=1 Tax=Colletotrichum cuscutae TaxID=1209917 RepID=A0AAI9V8M7_9PEZI|nr:hypothetical protein CCUS01_05693 [Colletotrichum cuscutae]